LSGSDDATRGPSTLPGVRVLVAIGPMRLFRIVAAITVVAAMIWTAVLRPDYLDPTQIGTDVSTYLAAGERLATGGQVYALSAGDRPVHIWPPYWSVPFVSPPTLAVLWAALSLLPAGPLMVAWWLGAFLITLTTVGWLIARGPPTLLAVLMPISLGVAITAWTGNVNGLLVGGIVLTWPLAERSGKLSALALGVIIAASAAVKVGPILLLAWLVQRRRWDAVAAAIIVGVGLAFATAAVAGAGIFAEYAAIAASTAGSEGIGNYGVNSLLVAIGAPLWVARLAPWAVLVGAPIACLVLRGKPKAAYATIVLGSVFGLPIVRFETLTVALAAFTPWVPWRGPERARPTPALNPHLRIGPPARFAVLSVVACSIAAVALSTSTSSLTTITNGRNDPVIVRFYFNGLAESFGYLVPPRTTERAWGPLTGAISGPIIVMDTKCRMLSSTDARRDGGNLVVDPSGVEFRAVIGGPGTESTLSYSDACASVKPDSLGPVRPGA
jgi:hypothetical protein